MKHVTLTGIIGIMIATPAFAAVGDRSFVTGETVASSCKIDVIGVASGDANANAYWIPNTYNCAAGTYLPDGDTWDTDSQYTSGSCKQCTAGSYCAGSPVNSPFTYSEDSDQGITSCGNTYSHSDAGSDSVDDCYRDCAAGDVAHLKENGTMTGRYYSNGTNECEPANDQQCTTGYHYVAAAPDLRTEIGMVGEAYGMTYGNKPISGGGGSGASTFGLTENGTWAVDYGPNKGILKGRAQCSTQGGTNNWDGNATTRDTLPDNAGQHCWCKLESYTPSGNSTQSLVGPWVFLQTDAMGADNCAAGCAFVCSYDMWSNDSGDLAFRGGMFDSLGAPYASCRANTISINWRGADGGVFEAGSCTYDGAITTPATAPDKHGYTFSGWKFIAQP